MWDKNLIRAVKVFSSVSPHIQFCGSIALNLYGVIKRTPHDIDMVINDGYCDNPDYSKLKDLYDPELTLFFKRFEDSRENKVTDPTAHSGQIDYQLRYRNFKGSIFGINFDLFLCYFPLDAPGTSLFYGQNIQLQNIKIIKEMKLAYYDRYGIKKHKEDLLNMGIKLEDKDALPETSPVKF